MSRLCLVTGATGAIGPSVVAAFAGCGYRIRVLARRPPVPDILPRDVELVLGDLLDGEIVRQATHGVDVVVHLAALLHVIDPPYSLREEYQRVNVRGTEQLVRSCEKASVSRIVYSSTIAVYGHDETGILTEGSAVNPASWYARTKLEAEGIVLSARDSTGNPIGSVLRLAAVYGSRVQGNYRRLVRALDRGAFIPLGRGRNHRALIHERDVARAALLAAEHPAACGEIFNVSDGLSPTLGEIIRHVCRALGRRPPPFYLPAAPISWFIRAAHLATSPIGVRLPLTPATLAKYLEDVRVDSSKIRERLKFEPYFDQAAGWRETVAGMKSDLPTSR